MTTKHPILLVDDEPEVLFSLRGLLRTEFELYTAESGAQALEVLRQRPIHVLVTDQRMPQMTGAQLLRRARADYPDTVRIIFTGYADLKAVLDAVNEGEIYRYLTKPWAPDELVAVLHQACAHHDLAVERLQLLADLRDHLQQVQALLQGDARDEAKRLLRAAGQLHERVDQALAPDKKLAGA